MLWHFSSLSHKAKWVSSHVTLRISIRVQPWAPSSGLLTPASIFQSFYFALARSSSVNTLSRAGRRFCTRAPHVRCQPLSAGQIKLCEFNGLQRLRSGGRGALWTPVLKFICTGGIYWVCDTLMLQLCRKVSSGAILHSRWTIWGNTIGGWIKCC